MEVDKEDDEDMPATARDLGLGFKWLHWEPKPRWSEECSPWHMSRRCFLNSCSSLVACLGTKEAVKHKKKRSDRFRIHEWCLQNSLPPVLRGEPWLRPSLHLDSRHPSK